MIDNNFQIMNARITFRNIPLHKLTNFSFQDITLAYKSFLEISGVSECVIVQTASRVEIFTVGNVQSGEVPDARRNFEADGSPAKNKGKRLDVSKILKTWASLAEMDQFDLDHWDQTLEIYKGNDVYEHLLRLASGLESLVIGKQEIVDELKKSILISREANASGKILDKLFDNIIRIATRIRDSSGFGENTTSVGDR